ncbi:MAG TPA: protein kinase, partial [Ktedonobacteraceae bacterium]|nr:protein kinase [Ktedonobacteraceae bacterium]
MAIETLQNGRYRRMRLLGSGGMGEVHLMEDTRVNRQVAIKVLRAESDPYPDSDSSKDAARLFQREARAIAALEHSNILPLYDFGEEAIDGVIITYMVMPYCPDGSLVGWARQGRNNTPLTPQDVAQLIFQAAEALQYAHDHTVIHLDVKPSNFLLRSNQKNPNRPTLLLADFGIARSSTTTASSSRTIRGTPTSMAPEQWSSKPVAASDQYALAVMAYEMLTGRPPFVGSMEQLMFQHFTAPPAPPSKLNPKLSPAIDAVLLRALAKKPEERFPSISAFAAALEQAVSGASTSLTPLNLEPLRSDSGSFRATLKISQTEANTGTNRTITLPGGKRLTVTVPAGAQNGQVIHLQGLGEQLGNDGVLLLTVAVTQTENTHTSDSLSAAPTLFTAVDSGASPSDILSVVPTFEQPAVSPARVSQPSSNFSEHDLPTVASSATPPSVTNKQAQPAPPRRGGASLSRILLIIGLLVLLILAGSGLYFGMHLSGNQPTNPAALSNTQPTKTPTHAVTPTPTVTPTP